MLGSLEQRTGAQVKKDTPPSHITNASCVSLWVSAKTASRLFTKTSESIVDMSFVMLSKKASCWLY